MSQNACIHCSAGVQAQVHAENEGKSSKETGQPAGSRLLVLARRCKHATMLPLP
jgi:hypothetical protein